MLGLIVAKQKYKNHRTHCPPFEKKHLGKSPGKHKTTILDEAVITLGYAQLSLGIYQWAPCLGFDPQLLHKSQVNKGQEANLPLETARTVPGQQTNQNLQKLITWTMTTNPNCVEKKNTAYLTVKETEYSVDRPLQNQKNQP